MKGLNDDEICDFVALTEHKVLAGGRGRGKRGMMIWREEDRGGVGDGERKGGGEDVNLAQPLLLFFQLSNL